MAVPWSAPGWMKTSNHQHGGKTSLKLFRQNQLFRHKHKNQPFRRYQTSTTIKQHQLDYNQDRSILTAGKFKSENTDLYARYIYNICYIFDILSKSNLSSPDIWQCTSRHMRSREFVLTHLFLKTSLDLNPMGMVNIITNSMIF